MMISYPGLSKLKTKPVIYEDVFSASDSGTLEQLKELSSKRKSMEDSINEISFVTEAIAREMSGGLTYRSEQDIQKLECYLPLLENLVHHITCNGKTYQLFCWISKLQIRWSSGLTQPSVFNIHGPKFYQVDDMYFELGMSLFIYGALLRERAHEILASDMVQSTTLFRKAAGVYNYLSQEILINLNSIKERPPEAMQSVSSIMSLVCLAEAQAVTARKAEENGNRGGLLAKLHCGVKEFLVEAINILQIVTKECNISSPFLDFIHSAKTLHESMSYKYHAEGLKHDGKIGIAIGFLRRALVEVKKSIPKEESWRLVFKQVIDELTALLQKYEHENEFVWREKVACDDELALPQSVKIVSPVSHQPQIWERTLVFKY
ncbi:hypothetical protein CASFOL_020653 [Castilleja foliolosa]|uniref:BRO1 domain-containing protein n=1 Tax=Castilleja foliolosa TaxID=1961234 RepID=A0ABD3D3H7_9LAMI